MVAAGVTNWEAFVEGHPQGHVLQSSAWGELKQGFGWQAEMVRAGGSGGLVLFRRLPLGLTLAYVPRGPLANWNDPAELEALVAALDAACRARRAICLKVEPDLPDTSDNAARLKRWAFSRRRTRSSRGAAWWWTWPAARPTSWRA